MVGLRAKACLISAAKLFDRRADDEDKTGTIRQMKKLIIAAFVDQLKIEMIEEETRGRGNVGAIEVNVVQSHMQSPF
jgi:hypothetical protein